MSGHRAIIVVALAAVIAIPGVCGAQTFRGGISGRIVDATGAVLPGVTVTATNAATGVARTTTSSETGDFSLPDLPLGAYTIEATLQGFQTVRTRVEVAVSQIASVELKMGLSQVAETINVTASALILDTVSTALSNVVRPKQVQDLPLNGRDFTRMLQLSPGVAGNSVNGVRTRGNNFQIDGADNNDAFQNTAAVNQGGVSGIAGTLLPIEAIDQFSVQSGGQAEMGRNAGSTVNLVIKSGSNEFHGSTFYFNRHEALSANSPVALPGSDKRQIRNNQYGFSLGGPIVRGKTFFIECKRPLTARGVKGRITDAAAMLPDRIDATGGQALGVIALSLTRRLNLGDKLLVYRGEADGKEKLSRALATAAAFARSDWERLPGNIVGLLWHAITPVLVSCL